MDKVIADAKERVLGSSLHLPDLCESNFNVTYDERRGNVIIFLSFCLFLVVLNIILI